MTYVIGPGWVNNAGLTDLRFWHLSEEEVGPIKFQFAPPEEREAISFDFLTIVWEFELVASIEGTVYLPLRAYVKPKPLRCLHPTPWTKE